MIEQVYVMLDNRSMTITIKGVEIWIKYVNAKAFRGYPKNENLAKIVTQSRNTIPHEALKLFNYNEKEEKEYLEASIHGEQYLADKVKEECLSKGLRLMGEKKT